MAALTVDFRKHSGPTPADDMAAQIITDWKLHTGLQATWILCLSTLPPDSGTLISKWNAKFTFIWKEGFGPLSNSPVLFLHSPGKTLLTLSLVQKWLGSPFPEDVWAWWLLMHWLQLQFTPCEALPSVWISFAWQYSQACSHPCCLCTFSYPNSSFQSTLHSICFDTALCKQPHLSVMTLCDLPTLWRASMFVFWIIAKSAVFTRGLQPCSWGPTILKSLATTLIKHTWSGQSSSSRLLENCRQVCWSRLEINFPGEWVPRSRVEDLWCSPLLWFQRTRDTRNLYCRDVH